MFQHAFLRAGWFFSFCLFVFSSPFAYSQQNDQQIYWMKIKASTKEERSALVNTGLNIETIESDYVVAFGTKKHIAALSQKGKLLVSFPYDVHKMDFPKKDEKFHNYKELMQVMTQLSQANPNLVRLEEIGKSLEGRSIVNIRMSADVSRSAQKPGIVFMGTHHAREHISTEMPLLLALFLVDQYNKNHPQIRRYLETREINIIPMVNPDGVEYDIAGNDYRMWRKNRRQNRDSSYGVDLNRNYGYHWGEGGASTDPESEIYRGEAAFSEPETQAIKRFIEVKRNLTTLLSFHTFSELILYPWGYTFDSIAQANDLQVFQKMAGEMAKFNKYTPQQSSDLYITSGDTTDWAYGTHKIFAFTFELDPKSMWNGGFYPGQNTIPIVFNKNLNPCLYLIEFADNPYRVLNAGRRFGFETELLSQ